MKRLWALVALPLLTAATPAMDAETHHDVRCFTALIAAADTADDAQTTAITIVAQYFYGRIDARAPNLDLESAMAAEMDNMTREELVSLLQSCSKIVEKRGQFLIDLGKRLEQREKKAPTT